MRKWVAKLHFITNGWTLNCIAVSTLYLEVAEGEWWYAKKNKKEKYLLECPNWAECSDISIKFLC